ncbi:hypothetical protein EVAR_65081_1 [Eumeta japonica]|uniref:Uncharacterized protein n=1 Tax=Eumeta variegata TaxID=151549 RepID=A0A4C2A4I3_EUMVA|nr:hypothetical protein EVAR_65081_1 [Eumeta japonica]
MFSVIYWAGPPGERDGDGLLVTVQRTKLCRSELPANDVMRSGSFPSGMGGGGGAPGATHLGVTSEFTRP